MSDRQTIMIYCIIKQTAQVCIKTLSIHKQYFLQQLFPFVHIEFYGNKTFFFSYEDRLTTQMKCEYDLSMCSKTYCGQQSLCIWRTIFRGKYNSIFFTMCINRVVSSRVTLALLSAVATAVKGDSRRSLYSSSTLLSYQNSQHLSHQAQDIRHTNEIKQG